VRKQTRMDTFVIGQRVSVTRYAMQGTRSVIDEETGETITRPRMRRVGRDIGTITCVQSPEFYTVRFDSPVPDVNDPSRSQATWSVYFRDIEGLTASLHATKELRK
jgi:hypothetical protein